MICRHPMRFHHLWGEGDGRLPTLLPVQCSQISCSVVGSLFCSLAPAVSTCCVLAMLLLPDRPCQLVGFLCPRWRPFHFCWTSQSVLWHRAQAEQGPPDRTSAVWCAIESSFNANLLGCNLCPCPGHWWDSHQ